MSFSISNTSASAVITDITTPSSVTGELTITSGSLPLSVGGTVSGTNTTLDNQKGSPYGTFQMFLQQGDALIDTYVNNTLYSSEKYSSGIVSVQTPIIGAADSLTMAVSDIDFSCYSIGAGFSGTSMDIPGPELMKQQSDGKIVCAGYFQTYQGISANRIVRLNTDLSIDDTFVYGTGFNNAATALAIQSDGKILVGGGFTSYNGTARNRIIRLNSDGSLDTTFTIGAGFNNNVWSIVVQSDNKILVSGDFATYSGASYPRIIRLNSNGSIDTTFAAQIGTNNTIFNTSLQSDGKIVAVGTFTNISGTSRNRIARLTSTGLLDNTFTIGTGFNSDAFTVTCQSDGKIIVGGFFATYSGSSSRNIVRINSGGTIDTSFAIGSGFTQSGNPSFVLDVTPLSNGQYFVSGNFDSYDGDAVGGLARLNSDGSLDTTFNQGTGLNYNVDSFGNPSLVLSNGQYLVDGDFSDYDGVSVPTFIAIDPMGKLLNCE